MSTEIDEEKRAYQSRNTYRLEARSVFELARRKGFWRAVKSWLTNTDNQLLPFDEVRKLLPNLGQHDLGIKTVELDNIVGSVGRYHDFDRAFLPRQTHTRSRWVNIEAATLRDEILPPIELYKIGEAYFVKDGNHRVSVARENGQAYIDAHVNEINVPVPVDASMSIDDLIGLREQTKFIEETHLFKVCPDACIKFSVPGGYDRLLEHISVHRYYLGMEKNRRISHSEAAKSWFDNVYLPLVKVIRQQHILEKFTNRTETDLYLWIIEHQYFLREEYHREISLDQAAAHFKEKYARSFVWRFLDRLRVRGRNDTENKT